MSKIQTSGLMEEVHNNFKLDTMRLTDIDVNFDVTNFGRYKPSECSLESTFGQI